MFRSLFCQCVVFLGVLCSLSLSLSLVSAGPNDGLLVVGFDRVSATTARLRFLNVPPSQQTHTLIQYTDKASFSLNRQVWHNCAIFSPAPACPSGTVFTSEDRELNITQGVAHITSYILRGLKPSTTYQVRVAYIDKSAQPQVQGPITSEGSVEITTKALSPLTTLDSLVASGGCGSLTSTGSMYYLRSSSEFGAQVYTCDVVSEITNVTVSIVPVYAYATIDSTPTTGLFNKKNQTLSVTAKQVDPLTIYNYTIPLGAVGTTTNFSFIVTSESGLNQTYTLSIKRAAPSATSEIAGPSSPVTAMIRSPAVPSNYSYRALLWAGTTVGPQSWKVWSDDLTVFPFSAFTITFPSTTGGGATDYSLASVLVSPATSNPVPGSCSNIYVGLFDTSGRSFKTDTCVAALNDYCSATPFGAATKWQNFTDPDGQIGVNTLYHPAPPTPTFTPA